MSKKNHDQSIDRIAERGGFSGAEAWLVVNGIKLTCGESKEQWAEYEQKWREYAERINLHYDELDRLRARVAELEAVRPEVGAIGEIAAERQRQKDREGWTTEHDDGHTAGTMLVAGACYALTGASRISEEEMPWRDRYAAVASELWPWDMEWFKPKPKEPRRDLIRAAALIVAEIERLDRCASSPQKEIK